LIRNNSNDQNDRPENRKLSLVTTDSLASNYPRSEHSPLIGPARLPTGVPLPTKPTSPATYSISGFNSPRMADYSSTSASPRTITTAKEGSIDASSNYVARDFRGQLDPYPQYPPVPYMASYNHPSPATPASHPYTVNHQGTTDYPSRRPMRDYGILPPLTREDTTLSSESSQSGYSLPPAAFSGQNLPLDPTKSSRVLPQPVVSMGSMPPQSDRPLPSRPSPPILPFPHDYRAQGSLAVLVRAGELAAIAAGGEAEQKGSP
jgi:hypothetical protein